MLGKKSLYIHLNYSNLSNGFVQIILFYISEIKFSNIVKEERGDFLDIQHVKPHLKFNHEVEVEGDLIKKKLGITQDM